MPIVCFYQFVFAVCFLFNSFALYFYFIFFLHVLTWWGLSSSIDLFTIFFQLLTWTSWGKSVDNTEKSSLKLLKLSSSNVICWKLTKIQLPKVARNFRGICMGAGTKTCPRPTIQTSVNFRNFVALYLRSLKAYHFQIWQFINFKALFLVVSTDFP